MKIDMPNCLILGTERFKSKKTETECGVLRWLQQDEMKCYRTLTFGDEAHIVEGLVAGTVVMLQFDVKPSRRDDTIGLYLCGVGANGTEC